MSLPKLSALIAFAQVITLGPSWAVELKEAEITTVKNMVARQEGSSGPVPAKTSDKIHENSKVTTENASMAELTFADSSITRLGANTLFSFQSKERLIKLDQGSMLIHTPPGNGGVTVEAGGVTGAVTGTTFLASRDKAGNVLFVLLEGAGGMKVYMGGTTASIRPGQAASIGTEVIKSGGKSGEPAASAGAPAISGAGVDRMAGEKPPDIRIFEMDVRRLVATSPLINDFKTPLPSTEKIGATIETQQAKIKAGKIEDFGLEVVAIAHTDGDLLVASHDVWDKEDLMIVNPRKKDAVATEDSLGIETAAGEGTPPPTGTPISRTAGGGPSAPVQMAPPIALNPQQIFGATVGQTQTSLTVSGITVESKMYDGTTDARISLVGAFLQGGVLTGVALANDAGGKFVSKNVAPKVPVIAIVTLTGPNSAQYVLTQPTLSGEIYKRPLTVTANDLLVPYNGVLFSGGNGVSYSGFVPGENEISLGLTPTYGGTSQGAVNKGAYTIAPQGLPSGNYEYTYANGTLTIQAVPFGIVTWKPEMKPDEVYRYVSTSAVAVDVRDVSYLVVDQNGQAYGDKRATIDSAGLVSVGRILGAEDFYVRADIKNDYRNYITDTDRKRVIIGKPADYENPFRRLLNPPSSDLLGKLDDFFFYRGKADGYTGGPDKFYIDVSTKTRSLGGENYPRFTEDTKVSLPGVIGDFYAMDKLFQNDPNVPEATVTLNSPETLIYAKEISFGIPNLDKRTLSLNGLKIAVPDYSDMSDTETGAGNATGVGVTSKIDTSTLTPELKNIPYYLRSASINMSPLKLYPSLYPLDLNKKPIDPANDPDEGNMFAGDYVAYLTYWKKKGDDSAGSKTINFFNQIGSTSNEPWGSAANGIDITFSDYVMGVAQWAPGDPAQGTLRPGLGDLMMQAGMEGITPQGEFYLNVADMGHFARGVLDDWSVYVAQRIKITLVNTINTDKTYKDLTFVSGDGGTRIDGTLWDAGLANLSFQSTANLTMVDSDFYQVGSIWNAESALDLSLNRIGIRGGSAGTTASLVAGGAVDLQNVDITGVSKTKISAGKGVTIKNDGNVQMDGVEMVNTSAGGTASNIAVVQTKEGALEMRNVTIEGFSGAEVGSDSLKNKGRVMISGTAATKYNIKELVGAAISADAKIQMEIRDVLSNALDGEMELQNSLPVAKTSMAASAELQAKLEKIDSGELAAIMNDPDRRDIKVDAWDVDLGAKTLRFNNASISAVNSIAARANTIVLQNSFMTVVRNSGMINMYVQTGLVNRTYGSVESGYLNFLGPAHFQIGNVLNLTVDHTTDISKVIESGKIVEQAPRSNLQSGVVNVIQL